MLEFSKIEDAARRLKGKIVDNRWHVLIPFEYGAIEKEFPAEI